MPETPTISAQEWNDIIGDIKKQEAVLLIGPQFIKHKDVYLEAALHEYLRENRKNEIVHYYERDGIFLFDLPRNKVRVARDASDFYNTIKTDLSTLKSIVQLPFHLIVSLNPDHLIAEAFAQYGVKHAFHYFQSRNRDNTSVDINTPSIQEPLIYNLFGSKEQDDSLVLDYDDVFELLQSILGMASLPDKVLTPIRKARTYIFIGFAFDKWYSQLLIKFLCNSQSDKRISINKSALDQETQSFVINHFKIQFTGDQYDFLEELYLHCQEAKLLRPLSEDSPCPEAASINNQVRFGNTASALDLLLSAAKGKDWENQVIMLIAAFNKLEADKKTITDENYRIQLAKINAAILELAKMLCL